MLCLKTASNVYLINLIAVSIQNSSSSIAISIRYNLKLSATRCFLLLQVPSDQPTCNSEDVSCEGGDALRTESIAGIASTMVVILIIVLIAAVMFHKHRYILYLILILINQGHLLLTWFNFNPSMDK